MKRILGATLLIATLFGGTATALAQAGTDGKRPPLIVSLDAADCRRLLAEREAADVAHRPRPDVAYQPGRDLDSQGRPIPPADLPGANPMPLTGPITLPLTIRLEDLLGSRTPAHLGESELGVAKVAIDPMTGKLAFNGQPLKHPAEDAIAQACREYLAGLKSAQ